MANVCKWIPCILLILLVRGEKVQIKIIDPPHNARYATPSSDADSSASLKLRAPPANISGPPHLRLLAGTCFTTKVNSYTYKVCPFHNVTQKEDSGGFVFYGNFHGVLGVWREWIFSEEKFVGMHYAMGTKCGSTDREAKVMFRCSTVTSLGNISEPDTCKYTIWMDTPLACIRGAMQVFSVFNVSQTEQWDQYDKEYHSGELTRHGLDKRRREMLLDAGLLYNFTKDNRYKSEDRNDGDAATIGNALGDNGALKCSKELSSANSKLEEKSQQLLKVMELLNGHRNMTVASILPGVNAIVNNNGTHKTNNDQEQYIANALIVNP